MALNATHCKLGGKIPPMTDISQKEARTPARFTLDVLDAHAGGNSTRVVTGGLPDLGGKNVREMRDFSVSTSTTSGRLWYWSLVVEH